MSIAGRNYTVACADGDEDRVRQLAGMIADRLEGIGATLNTPMEAHNLLVASLILADELDEANTAAAASPSPDPAPTPAPAEARRPVDPELDFTVDLEELAQRLENAADALESEAQTS